MKNIIFPGLKKFFEKTHQGDQYIHRHLAEVQRPTALVVACSDSRIGAPLAEVEPGTVFAVRNIANLIPPYKKGMKGYLETSSAIEYGVRALKVDHLIVKGHTNCGGINRALRNKILPTQEKFEFVDPWVELVAPIAEEALKEMEPKKDLFPNEEEWFRELTILCERKSIVHSLENLLTYPWIKERYEARNLLLHGWHFNIVTGEIHFYDDRTKQWDSLMKVISGEKAYKHGETCWKDRVVSEGNDPHKVRSRL